MEPGEKLVSYCYCEEKSEPVAVAEVSRYKFQLALEFVRFLVVDVVWHVVNGLGSCYANVITAPPRQAVDATW